MLEEIVITFDWMNENPDHWKIFQDKEILGVVNITDRYIRFLVKAA